VAVGIVAVATVAAVIVKVALDEPGAEGAAELAING
jgi:hypothetical protein